MDFKKNILRVFSANFLSLVSGILLGFIIPAFLSIESYSYLKTYTFYISYVTCLHFGFIDGMYIKYGGKNLKEIKSEDLMCEHKVMLILQSVITIIIALISIISNDIILFILALSILPINMSSFYKQLYQATGNFKSYSNISYGYTIIYLILNILLVFIFKSKSYVLYCLTTVISNFIIYLIMEIKFYRQMRNVKFIYDKSVWKNIKVGVYILIGNFAVIFFYALDRWFVKIFYGINDFAYYSFAVSMLNIINTLVTAISSIFYNYLCKAKDNKQIDRCKKYLLIISSLASSGYFALAIIISFYLEKYIPSLSVIAISFASYPYLVVINSIYLNLYKIYEDKSRYVIVVAKMIFISAIYNIVCITISKNLESISFATTLAFITWYIYSLKDFKFLKSNKSEIIYLTVVTVSFLLLSHLESLFIGGTIYVVIVIGMSILIYKEEIYEILNIFIKRNN